MDVREVNVLVLAYLGDCVYENAIRKYLISMGIGNVNDLQRETVKYVSAKSQALYVQRMIDRDFLTVDEMDVFRRARNNKNRSHPRNCDILTYKYATGLEAIIGYLELLGRRERIDEIMNFILNSAC